MAALVASSVSAEWEMVYMVSWVAMPTMAALVVMLARWKGKRPPAVPGSNPPPPNDKTSTPSKMQQDKAQSKEIIRRVTSCPNFAVVRVVKASSKCGRQLSYSNLTDRRLQDEIAELADKLLSQAERRCEWGQECECEWGQGFECEKQRRCESGAAACEQTRAFEWSEKEESRSGFFSQGGNIAFASSKQVLTTKRAKKVEDFTTRGSGSQIPRAFETVSGGAMQPPRPSQSVPNKPRVMRQMGRLEYYNQLRSIVPSKLTVKSQPNGFDPTPFHCLTGLSVVRYWGQEHWVSGKPGGIEQTSLWSVSKGGVVESWDSRAGGAPMLCHSLRLRGSNQGKLLTVEGLDVMESELRVRLTAGGGIVLDKRKIATAVFT